MAVAFLLIFCRFAFCLFLASPPGAFFYLGVFKKNEWRCLFGGVGGVWRGRNNVLWLAFDLTPLF